MYVHVILHILIMSQWFITNKDVCSHVVAQWFHEGI